MSRAPLALALLLLAAAARPAGAEGVNKIKVDKVEAAVVIATGNLKVRLNLATAQALDYEFKDPDVTERVLKLIEIGTRPGGTLFAEVSTDGRSLRALHVAAEPRPGR